MSARRILVLGLVLSMTATSATIADQISSANSATPMNAFIDLGTGPYPDAAQVTTSSAAPGLTART